MCALFGRYPWQQVSHTVAIMSHTSPRPSHPLDHGSAFASLFGSFVEWEERPAAVPSLDRPGDARAAPFAEPIRGLHVREIDGPDVFSHFFGHARISH
jgi:hypothetical protein